MVGRHPNASSPSPSAPLRPPAAFHLAVFSALAEWSGAFAGAVALNWARQRLSLPKLALLAFLGMQQRAWLYFVWLGAKLIDAGLARLMPPVRKFFWWACVRVFGGGTSATRSWGACHVARLQLRCRWRLPNAHCHSRAASATPAHASPLPWYRPCRANFLVWALYLLLTPAYYAPLPFWPFAPGSLGLHEG